MQLDTEFMDSRYATIAGRLKLERERTGLTQTEFAALGGLSKHAQFTYEQGKRYPDAEFLQQVWQKKSVDVCFVITGKRSSVAESLSDKELNIIELFRSADAKLLALIDYLLECNYKQAKLQQELQKALGPMPIPTDWFSDNVI